MEANLVKGLIGFMVVMAVGFIIIASTRESQQEKVQGAFLQTSGMLNSLAMSKCSEAVKNEVGTHPYTPSESNSDGMTYVTLIWNNVGSVAKAECRYIIDQGITLLRLDDRTLIEKTQPTDSLAPSAPKPMRLHH
jgi:hypothetical protein